MIFIGRLDISYDYALDYDINYNEECMSLSDFAFSRHFHEQLEIARKNYTQIGEKSQEDEPY